jgi:WD40 repeat protein
MRNRSLRIFQPNSGGEVDRLSLGIFFLILISMACNPLASLVRTSTPEPFPVPDVSLLTKGVGFYKDLLWSPDGDTIAATRCPVINQEPRCLEGQQVLLINVHTGESEEISFPADDPDRATSRPVAWSQTGAKLLLYTQYNQGAISEAALSGYRYLIYELGSGAFTEIAIEGTIAAWDSQTESVLLIRAQGEQELALGWLSLTDRSFQEEVSLSAADQLAGPYALSPSGQHLIVGDNDGYGCDGLYEYRMGSHESIAPLLLEACYPAWSPDGTRLAYASQAGNQRLRLMIADPDGSKAEAVFAMDLPWDSSSPAWSPDGRQLAFTYGGQGNANAIYIVEVHYSQ